MHEILNKIIRLVEKIKMTTKNEQDKKTALKLLGK